MVLALGYRECLADVVDVRLSRPTERHRPRVRSAAVDGLVGFELRQPRPEDVVDQLLERLGTAGADLVKLCRHVIIEGERRPHTSKHSSHDALMTRCQWARAGDREMCPLVGG